MYFCGDAVLDEGPRLLALPRLPAPYRGTSEGAILAFLYAQGCRRPLLACFLPLWREVEQSRLLPSFERNRKALLRALVGSVLGDPAARCADLHPDLEFLAFDVRCFRAVAFSVRSTPGVGVALALLAATENPLLAEPVATALERPALLCDAEACVPHRVLELCFRPRSLCALYRPRGAGRWLRSHPTTERLRTLFGYSRALLDGACTCDTLRLARLPASAAELAAFLLIGLALALHRQTR